LAFASALCFAYAFIFSQLGGGTKNAGNCGKFRRLRHSCRVWGLEMPGFAENSAVYGTPTSLGGRNAGICGKICRLRHFTRLLLTFRKKFDRNPTFEKITSLVLFNFTSTS